MESSPVARGKADGRRGRRSHVNLQFSCSFFLQGEGIPNGRLRERAGRLDMVSAAGRALDSAMRWDCGRRRKLRGRCCLECGCRDRQLQADGGGFRSFGEFAEISRLLWLRGAQRQRRCPLFGGVGICSGGVVSRIPQQTLNQNPVYIKLDPYCMLRRPSQQGIGGVSAYSEPKYGSGTYTLISPLCHCVNDQLCLYPASHRELL